MYRDGKEGRRNTRCHRYNNLLLTLTFVCCLLMLRYSFCYLTLRIEKIVRVIAQYWTWQLLSFIVCTKAVYPIAQLAHLQSGPVPASTSERVERISSGICKLSGGALLTFAEGAETSPWPGNKDTRLLPYLETSSESKTCSQSKLLGFWA